MKKFYLFLIVSLLMSGFSGFAGTNYYFFVQFKNKNNTPYSLSNPAAYLSARAIARRADFGISCDSTDLPVNPAYINQISTLGITVHSKSKWMNGITVRLTDDTSMISMVRMLSTVKKVQYTGKIVTTSNVKRGVKFQADSLNYGSAVTQVNQLNIKSIHNEGYMGQGMLVGVMDAGFSNVNINPGFDSLRLQGRLLGTKDIYLSGNNVYAEDAHGANVLSIITGNLPGKFLGMAPKASFWLIRTEFAPTENLFETDFWVSGIEFADSVGVDVVNSSLGYTQFDDVSMNYTYADMNGQVSRASKAATMAANKGIVVCNSAGNDGAKTWHYIGAPADANGIFAVGAVTGTGIASSFTSFGPTSDNRVKPDVCAMGTATALINTSGLASAGNGTSYSSPVMTGALTCLLQKYKSSKPAPCNLATFRNAVIMSSSLYQNPTAQLGYGIPDIDKAAKILLSLEGFSNHLSNSDICQISYAENMLNIAKNNAFFGETVRLVIYDALGRQVHSALLTDNIQQISCDDFARGVYVVMLSNGRETQTHKFLKAN